MKAKIFLAAIFAFASAAFAQDRTTVTANSNDISDNLDLKAVASIFGDSENLEDFERRLNDPAMQISNLDLNNDNQVDYLRVIESVEKNTHLVIIQSVIGRDLFQDVATVEVDRDRNNNVQVQVVGDVYMYGPNYIYEPVYVSRPVIFTNFWIGGYRPYYSPWYWSYYPTYYYAWEPCPIFRYRRNVNVYINVHNHYNYVNVRRSRVAASLYAPRRANAYERRYPERAFVRRHTEVANRYELDQHRNIRNAGTRNAVTSEPRTSTRNNLAQNTPRPNGGTRNQSSTRDNAAVPRTRSESSVVNSGGSRSDSQVRTNVPRTRSESNAVNNGTRSENQTRNNTPRTITNTPRPSVASPSVQSATRADVPRESMQISTPRPAQSGQVRQPRADVPQQARTESRQIRQASQPRPDNSGRQPVMQSRQGGDRGNDRGRR